MQIIYIKYERGINIMSEKDKVREMAREIIEKGKKAQNSEEFIRTQLDNFKSLLINLGYSNDSIAFLEGIVEGSQGSLGMMEQRNNSGEELPKDSVLTKKVEPQTTEYNTISGCASCGGSRSSSRC